MDLSTAYLGMKLRTPLGERDTAAETKQQEVRI